MANVTGIVIGIIGKTLTDVTAAFGDGKVTLGEVFDISFGVAAGIGGAFPGWVKTLYKIDSKVTTPQLIVEGFAAGLPLILDGFGAKDCEIGKV